MASVLSSLRYLLADFIGEDSGTPPPLPDNLPEAVAPDVSEYIRGLVEYQGAKYARLYEYRLRRFIGRAGVDVAMLGEIARLMAMRMSYQDPIRIAQLKLAGYDACADLPHSEPSSTIGKFRLDELIAALPAVVAEPMLDLLEWAGWTHMPVSIKFNSTTRLGILRLKVEAGLRRWRRFSVRYARERVWVERWLHMIDRALIKQPAAASEIVQTATMIQGYGDGYRQGEADWHAIIDGLVKPTCDGVLPLVDLAGAIAEARAAAVPDRRQIALKRKIAEIRTRAQPEQQQPGAPALAGTTPQ